MDVREFEVAGGEIGPSSNSLRCSMLSMCSMFSTVFFFAATVIWILITCRNIRFGACCPQMLVNPCKNMYMSKSTLAVLTTAEDVPYLNACLYAFSFRNYVLLKVSKLVFAFFPKNDMFVRVFIGDL